MASSSGKQVFQRVRSFLASSRKPQFQSNTTGLSPESSKAFSSISGRRNPRLLSRFPVELGGMQSLMPLHSVTASALLNSMLSSKVGQWSSISEGASPELDLQHHYNMAYNI
ncbi:hypothetical protein Ccrd_005183 [Cynara cardunculus var. scolymus]|uniref:Protein NUCLEAR FUSION DEFECTIVE 6, chloroplastic/mitochondrial-like n=1 Tax=Cynara cardunculus var. scolymus TaxID=59895 RepID=A0A103XLD0_CYNCS|nr:hypothetical protein Ccrd_005183 [Cynara cardunculus var. scolymus]